ncbi:uncharacterized protein LOC121382800 isoform X2 [Gigantopelta aegis]|uniref:uncharacterized protein LOC121382800 isoform X2 n=1 Tax=Gigantopelta aegis TaxID=1735272 RepID=UPI001B88A5E1|nr:uncharacterized protein LOC121382800 isoform X2 [Gigantopelta aegis]
MAQPENERIGPIHRRYSHPWMILIIIGLLLIGCMVLGIMLHHKQNTVYTAIPLTNASIVVNTRLVAKFNLGGISGDAKFSQVALLGDVTLEITIKKGVTTTPVTGDVTWEIRNHWVDLSVKEKCASAGMRYGALGSTDTSRSDPVRITIPGSSLNDANILQGRTLHISVVSGSTTYTACATINVDVNNVHTKYNYYVADMAGAVMGSIWFRSFVDGGGVQILPNLYVHDTQKAHSRSYNWTIVAETVTSCSHVTTRQSYNPLHVSGNGCTTTDPEKCAVGDLCGKLGEVPVGSNYGSARTLFRDTSFNISGVVDISSKIIVIVDQTTDEVMGCSRIVAVSGRHSVAKFSNDGVIGNFQFLQTSPFDYTEVRVSVYNLQNKAAGYHIHAYPVPYKALETQSVCDVGSVGGHFNPYRITVNPDPKKESFDKYEVGDISGKFGLLTGETALSATYWDNNLPMFGPSSIMGKSVVIHYTSGARWVCSNIIESKATITAMATFKYPVSGHVLLRQVRDDDFVETSVFVSLDYTDGQQHPEFIIAGWMIHSSPVGYDDQAAEFDRCQSTLGTYDPSMMGTGNLNQCFPGNQRGCRVGDLTRKLSQSVTLTPGKAVPRKFTFVDGNLPLSGPSSVIGKSIVVYGSGLKTNVRIACATIKEVRTQAAKVDGWSESVTGFIKFSQTAGVIHQFTDMNVDLKNLNNMAEKYHVHLFPVPTGSDVTNPCSSKSVGGHFNPFNVSFTGSPAPAKGTNDQYEVGDLSGKFGLISNRIIYSRTSTDSNLNLFGVNSIVGRSIVIHRDDAASSRWVCASIVQDLALTGGTYIQASATFRVTETTLTGYIQMGQYVYPDGSYSDTNILMDINYPDEKTHTLKHNWHVHEKPISGDGKAATKVCSSVGPHYNPYMVNVTTGYENCKASNPLRCELGDQANKVGTYDMGGGKRVFTDVDLPLSGPYSVIGRSFVIHVPDRGAGRLACADIIAVDMPVVQVTIKKPTTLIKRDILRQYAEALQTGWWNLAVVVNSDDNGCLSVDVYFTGDQATSLKIQFVNILKSSNKTVLGSFSPVVCGTVCNQASMTLLTVCLCGLLKLW